VGVGECPGTRSFSDFSHTPIYSHTHIPNGTAEGFVLSQTLLSKCHSGLDAVILRFAADGNKALSATAVFVCREHNSAGLAPIKLGGASGILIINVLNVKMRA
jgi:hypothetical protein